MFTQHAATAAKALATYRATGHGTPSTAVRHIASTRPAHGYWCVTVGAHWHFYFTNSRHLFSYTVAPLVGPPVGPNWQNLR